MLSIPEAVAQIKGRFPDSIPETLVQRLAQEVGHRWRDRDLGPVVTTYLFLQQILHGNIAITELRRLTDTDFSAPAYCQARARWPRTLLGRLQRAVTQTLASTTEVSLGELWHGHRVYLLDGSSFSMPDTPELQAHFGQPTGQAAGCGFPVAHLVTRFDARTGYLMETAAAPLRRSDLASTAVLHAGLCPGDVLIGDRAFGSYAHLAVGLKRGIHGLYRAHQKQIVCFRPHRAMSRRGETGKPRSRWLKRLGQHDQLVEYFKPSKRPSWLTAEEYAQLPDSLVVRAVRYRIKQPGRRTREVTLVTTLLDPEQYSAKALAKLYGLRWVVETNRKHLKQTLKMDLLRCTTVEGVLKELTVFVLIDNLVRRVMCAAARRQRVAPERISFVDAWRWLRYARPGEAVPELVVNPERPGRFEPRVRKRRPKEFPVMKKPRAELRKALKQQKPAA